MYYFINFSFLKAESRRMWIVYHTHRSHLSHMDILCVNQNAQDQHRAPD